MKKRQEKTLKTAHLAKEFVGGADENQFFPPRGKQQLLLNCFQFRGHCLSRLRTVLCNFQAVFRIHDILAWISKNSKKTLILNVL
jgi:hypothetical protein